MTQIKLRVVSITNNIEAYPKSVSDTLEFPYLVDYVEDEQDTFIVDTSKVGSQGQFIFWNADEFFHMVLVTEMTVDIEELYG